jgi:hypothetical protein
METLTLNDGTVYQDSYASESCYGLYVRFGGGLSMIDVLLILADSGKTSRITYTCNKVEIVFEGYTKPVAINDEGNGVITALLKKEVVADGSN